MKVIGLIVLLVIGVGAIVVLAGQAGFLGGAMPSDIGVHNGRLKPPSLTPNSVSSQADLYPDHTQHDYARIAPIPYTGDPNAAMQKLADILQQTERTNLVIRQPDYLYAQCTTATLKFIDDVEFWLDRNAGVIHVRSASRLGRSDLGVNRTRIEKIRARFQTERTLIKP